MATNFSTHIYYIDNPGDSAMLRHSIQYTFWQLVHGRNKQLRQQTQTKTGCQAFEGKFEIQLLQNFECACKGCF